MRIAVDAMGGDYAPVEVIAGAALAAQTVRGEIILVGREQVLVEEMSRQHVSLPNLSIRHAEEVVEMDDNPLLALRQKAGSSVTVCVNMVREGEAEAAVSAGNSGAMMAASTMRLRTLPGVERPAIAVFFPTSIGKRICLDAGANADCKPEHLAQFALMGSVYAEHALGISSPRVGVLSLGTERCKGSALTLAAYELIEALPVNFIGNIEGNQIFSGEVDVTVCDGYVGNVALKVLEGVGQEIFDDFKAALKANWITKLGALFQRRHLRAVAAKYDYAEYGGALLLGVNGISVIAHGKSDRRAVAKAIEAGAVGVETGVLEHMKVSFSQALAESAALAGSGS
jgi:phosphate acyltransferase